MEDSCSPEGGDLQSNRFQSIFSMLPVKGEDGRIYLHVWILDFTVKVILDCMWARNVKVPPGACNTGKYRVYK